MEPNHCPVVSCIHSVRKNFLAMADFVLKNNSWKVETKFFKLIAIHLFWVAIGLLRWQVYITDIILYTQFSVNISTYIYYICNLYWYDWLSRWAMLYIYLTLCYVTTCRNKLIVTQLIPSLCNFMRIQILALCYHGSISYVFQTY